MQQPLRKNILHVLNIWLSKCQTQSSAHTDQFKVSCRAVRIEVLKYNAATTQKKTLNQTSDHAHVSKLKTSLGYLYTMPLCMSKYRCVNHIFTAVDCLCV